MGRKEHLNVQKLTSAKFNSLHLMTNVVFF